MPKSHSSFNKSYPHSQKSYSHPGESYSASQKSYSASPDSYTQLSPRRLVLPLIIASALIIIISLLILIHRANLSPEESPLDSEATSQLELAESYASLDPILSITPYYSPDAHFILYATPRDSEPTLLKVELNACDPTLKSLYLSEAESYLKSHNLNPLDYELNPVGLCDDL